MIEDYFNMKYIFFKKLSHTFRLPKGCKLSTENSPSFLNCDLTLGESNGQNQDINTDITLLTKLLRLRQFSHWLLFTPGSNPGSRFAWSCVFLAFSSNEAVAQSFLVFRDLDTSDEHRSVIL